MNNPTTHTHNDVTVALNRAAEDILAAINAPDEGVRDAINAIVNVAAHYLDWPNDTLQEALDASYGDDSVNVLDWIGAAA